MSDDKPLVGILLGSRSDWDTMKVASETLARFDVAHECRVLSAHRTPAATTSYVTAAEERGLEVLIAAAGMAAHLAGAVAAHTVLPVLGVPMEGGPLKGLDALLATVQMPGGVRWGRSRSARPGPRMRRYSPWRSSPISGRSCARSCAHSAKSKRQGCSRRVCPSPPRSLP